jgi:hypothetical protein
MSRLFDGIDDFITFSVGGAANLPTAALTTVFLWRPNANHRGGLLDGKDGGSARQIGVNPFDNGDVFFAANGSTSTGYAAYLNQWAILGFTKPAGAGQTVRAHVYRYDTLAWTHTNLGAVSANAAIASIFVGSFDGGQFLNGNMAAIGLWTGTALSDANFEAGTGFQTSLANWFNLTPSVLWRFNQASVATPVTDLMSSGADQTAITGTTVSVDEPPGFSYDLVSTVTGTGLADLGSLDAAAAGLVTHSGTGAADLGALGATASGGVTVAGTAQADLGRLVAAATVPAPPDPDMFVSVLMEQLLICLCENVAAQPNPPLHCCFRVGTEVAHDAGILQDQCCEGIAYVALGDTYPSSDSFPEADIVRQANSACAPPTWAQVFQVGIIRCLPTGDQFLPPNCDDWNAAARQNVIDAQTLRRVACCMRNYITQNGDLFLGMSLVIDRQTQGNPQGGCVERQMKLTIQFPNICDGC